MISRRAFLKTTIAGAGAFRAVASRALSPPPGTEPDFAVPPGACDCHVHVFDPRRFPYPKDRRYTAGPADVGELLEHERSLHLERMIIVQPSAYGTDNRCALDAVRRIGANARGIAVIGQRTPERALDELDRAGFRGIRLTPSLARITAPAAAREVFRRAVGQVGRLGWLIDWGSSPRLIDAIAEEVGNCPVPVVFDHFGGIKASAGLDQPGFRTLLRLVESGKAYVKISGAADSVGGTGPDYADVAPFAQALIAANPHRIVWGSNWPHPVPHPPPGGRPTDPTPFLRTDDGRVLNLLREWEPHAGNRWAILVENPAQLYGF